MSKHLTLNDRSLIERALILGSSFTSIGEMLGRSPTTIAREVKKHRVFANRSNSAKNDCMYFQKCVRRNLCDEGINEHCIDRCKLCKDYDCRTLCLRYSSIACEELNLPPYVCNGCKQERNCRKEHAYYAAHKAHSAYLKELSDSRKGLRVTPEELDALDKLISPLVKKGQSLNLIMTNHKDEIQICEKSLYNYVNANVFQVRDIDLPKKVAYRPRKQDRPVLTKLEYKYRLGRTWECFEGFQEEHPDTPIVEMDTVKGARGCKKTLLTFLFCDSNFMLAFLLKDATKQSVLNVFDYLSDELGLAAFRELFPVILTDNGVEFKDPISLEITPKNAHRTSIFYCDPQASWQKPHVEKNHVELRKIIPKGTSFSKLTKEDVRRMLCHINSEAREVLDGKTPFDLFTSEKQKKLLDLLDLHPVPADEVTLSPSLLNLRKR